MQVTTMMSVPWVSAVGHDTDPRIKSLSGASSLGFMCVRAAGQPRGAYSVNGAPRQ